MSEIVTTLRRKDGHWKKKSNQVSCALFEARRKMPIDVFIDIKHVDLLVPYNTNQWIENKTKHFADLNDSNTETDADAEGESTNEDANASASVVVPSSPKRKRRQPPKTYATPARKRGRPAAKTNGESTSIKPAPSRTSLSRGRASEKITGDSRRRSSKTGAADRNRRTSKRLSTAKVSTH